MITAKFSENAKFCMIYVYHIVYKLPWQEKPETSPISKDFAMEKLLNDFHHKRFEVRTTRRSARAADWVRLLNSNSNDRFCDSAAKEPVFLACQFVSNESV